MPQLLGPNGGPVRLFGRSCTLDVGRDDDNQVMLQNAIRISGLRVAFKITKSDKPTPNTSEVQIYNLSPAHRAQLELRDTRCLLSAGYVGSEALIFSGNVKHAESSKNGEDVVTKLELGDGSTTFAAQIAQHFGPGTNLVDVVKALGAKLVKDPGNLLAKVKDLNAQFSRGFVVSGSASAELTRVLEPHGLGWSVQDGRIQVLAPSEFLPGDGPQLSADTGLVGSPTWKNAEKKTGVRPLHVKCLLHPALRPGSGFRLQSSEMKGEFRCRTVTHTADTHGPDWTTDIEALPRS